MYFEEHIERLKKEFPSSDFRIPFTEAKDVLKKIEKKYIKVKDIQSDLNNFKQYCSNWGENLKNKIELSNIKIFQVIDFLNKLDQTKKYWTIITHRNNSPAKHYIYETKLNSMVALFKIRTDDFFILDKKYEWLIYFQIDREKQTATIYASGSYKTLFD